MAEEMRLFVPTFYGHLFATETERGERDEFGSPERPVLVYAEAGIRIVFGTHNSEDLHQPDIKIERHPNGWAIFIHPDAGDPCGYLYLRDDGRSFLLKEWASDPAREIEILEPGPKVPGFHDLEPEMDNDAQCRRCHARYDDGGDGYNGFCPACADHLFSWLCEVCDQPVTWEDGVLHHVTDDGKIDSAADADHPPAESPD